jgi:uncharacterized membrane protein YeaQ/YmgE (transglycosylase-associated protein family)
MFAMMIWVALGIMVAIAVRVVLRVKDPDGIVVTVLLGVAGALLGGLLSVALELADFGERTAVFAALSGAVAALGLKAWMVRYESKSG